MNRLARSLVQRLRSMLEHIADHHAAPELLVAVAIMTGWAAAGFSQFGFVAVVAAILLGWALHGVAAETGGFGWLWLATGLVLLYMVFARSTVLSGASPLWLATAGATALAYNEAVRANHWRRRRARTSPGVFASSALAVAAAGLLGVAGVAAARFISGGSQSSTWWQPLAAVALFALAVALLLLPTLRTPESSRERWTPGTRLPAPPKVSQAGPGYSTGDLGHQGTADPGSAEQ